MTTAIRMKSQKNDIPGVAAFGFEISYPQGRFGNSDLNIEENGMAEWGPILAIQGGVGFKNNSGLSYKLMHTAWLIDVDQMKYQLNITTNPSVYSYAPWKSTALMFGMFKLLPLTRNQRIIFNLNGMLGAAYSSYPYVNYVVDYYYPANSFTLSGPSTVSFAGLLAGDIRFDIGDNFSFLIYSSIYYTQPTFKGVVFESANGVEETNVSMPILTTNFGFGFGVQLGKKRKKTYKRGRGRY